MRVLQVTILKRALGEKGVEEIVEQYKDAKLKRGPKPPTEKQVRLANLGKKFGALMAAKKAGVSPQLVNYCIDRVGRWEWLNK
jgi:hypothetical protein